MSLTKTGSEARCADAKDVSGRTAGMDSAEEQVSTGISRSSGTVQSPTTRFAIADAIIADTPHWRRSSKTGKRNVEFNKPLTHSVPFILTDCFLIYYLFNSFQSYKFYYCALSNLHQIQITIESFDSVFSKSSLKHSLTIEISKSATFEAN
uniref:uncharacterized protein LOC117609220 n=1 Tax=Osmia lignaria TaxID=473952 RepID=UPI001478FDAC|nr:uncharacterized protein LOC117609220 [Osmia lignaria]